MHMFQTPQDPSSLDTFFFWGTSNVRKEFIFPSYQTTQLCHGKTLELNMGILHKDNSSLAKL